MSIVFKKREFLGPCRYKKIAKPKWTPPNYVFPLMCE